MYGPLAYVGFMSPDRGIFTRGAVMEKVVGPGGSDNTGGQITTGEEEQIQGQVQVQGQLRWSMVYHRRHLPRSCAVKLTRITHFD